MKMRRCILFAVLLAVLEIVNAKESYSSCYTTSLKILLDSASTIIRNARNLTEDLESISDNGIHSRNFKPMDCEDIMNQGFHESGVYKVQPRSRVLNSEIHVACDMDTDGGGWTVFQRRGDFGRSKDYFFKDWNDYKSGFGKISQDFWLGNHNIFALSNQKAYTLRIDMMDMLKEKRYAEYENFWIAGEEFSYALHVDGYSGNAGDSLTTHSGVKFATKDRDSNKCASQYKGGWWYHKCHESNLNGLYLNGSHSTFADGIEWLAWKGYNYSFPVVEMKIRTTATRFASNNNGEHLTP